MTIILNTEKEDFDRVLAQNGYKKNNFELITEEDPLPAKKGVRIPVTGYVTVKHRESGVTRSYKAEHMGISWVSYFKDDLKAEIFPFN